MRSAPYREALDAFGNSYEEFIVEPVSNGLINHSYKVTHKLTGYAFLLQQVNTHVFPDPALLQGNYHMLWTYLQNEEIPFAIPAPKYVGTEPALFYDTHKHYWRAFEYVPGTISFPLAKDAAQASAVAKTFASFTASFAAFDISRLHITIPGFHDLLARFEQFQEATRTKNFERLLKAAPLIEQLKKREPYANLYEVMIGSGEFPLRVMHHDAKIANILFDEKTGAVLCPVDFDTVMPGYFFSDLGDMIRTMACSKDENSIDNQDLHIREDFYEAIVQGYLSIMEQRFTEAEKKYIHYAGIIMIYMQALRFITDYLQEDQYYKVDYREQNYDRANNQLLLLTRLEEMLGDKILRPAV